MEKKQIIDLRDGRFEVHDFDSENMIAEIQFDGSPDIHFVWFYAPEIMECAMSDYIESWEDSPKENGDPVVYEYNPHHDDTIPVSFPVWWDSISTMEKGFLIKSAIMRFADAGLRRLEVDLIPSETAIREMKKRRVAA